MKKLWLLIKKYNEICYMSCLGSGILLLISRYWNIEWPPALLFPAVLLVQILLLWSGERNIRLQLFAGLFLLHLLPILYFVRTDRELDIFYRILSLEIPCILLSVFCYIVRHSLLFKGILLLPQLAVLIYFSIMQISLSKWVIWLILFCLLFYLAELIEHRISPSSDRNILYLFPFLLAATTVLFLFPVKDTPLQWTYVKKAAAFMNEQIQILSVDINYLFSGSSDSFFLSETGFSTDSSLGGDVVSSDKPQITIAGTTTRSPLYLTGSVYNSYTGRGWQSDAASMPSGAQEYLRQHQELVHALSQSTLIAEDEVVEKAEQYIRPNTYDVYFDGLKTKHLFYSPFTYNFVFPEGERMDMDSPNTAVLTRARGVGFHYLFLFYEFNLGSEEMENLLRQKAWRSTYKPLEQQAAKREYAYSNYTSLPASLPSRVSLLAEEITTGLDNDYDRLKAIETYLQQYEYSTSPESCPSGQDFTDFFLFEGKRGYCSYYATSLAVLGRCLGIPTRYVEGFVSKDTPRYQNYKLQLTGSDAHAWVEAYIENIGWIPFDPTPGYNEAAYQAWPEPKGSEESASSAENSSMPLPPDQVPDESTLSDLSSDPEAEANRRREVLHLTGGIVFVLLSFLLLIPLFLLVRRQIRRRSYRSLSDYEKLASLMRKIFLIGRLYGYVQEEGETLTAFALRTENRLDTPAYVYGFVCDLFQAVRFGDTPADTAALGILEEYLLGLEKQYLKDSGLLKRLLYSLY